MDRKIELTRRKILGGLGAIGLAGAGTGLGTSALFSDEESFEGNVVTAGTLDLLVGYYSYWDQGRAGSGSVGGQLDGGAVSATLDDVKPGDNGLLAFCPQIEDNPAYLWLCGELTANDENGIVEPESEVDESENEGELAQNIEVAVSYCELDDDIGDEFDPEDVDELAEVWTGTLHELLENLENGVPLDGNGAGDGFVEPGGQACFDGTGEEVVDNPCLCIDWKVPIEVGNEIQSDSIEFDLSFHAEQCRNNDGLTSPCGDGEPEIPDVVSISASPNTAGDTDSTHRVEVPVGSGLDGESLSSLTVDYPDDFGLGDVDPGDVLGAGVERTDASIDSVSVTGTAASDGDTEIEFPLGGGVNVASGDSIFIEYREVMNASTADDYTVVVDVNGSEIGPGTLTIEPASQTQGPVTSTFDEDDEGWQITGDAQRGAAVPDYEDSEGNPAPSISATDDVNGGVWRFSAPGKYLGDKSGFYGGTLEFDLMQEYSSSSSSQFDSTDIILEGGGLTLEYDTDQNPGDGSSGVWTSYSVTIDESDDWEVDSGGSATQSDIEDVLSDLTRLEIRGEYRSGSDKGYLDNVSLSP